MKKEELRKVLVWPPNSFSGEKTRKGYFHLWISETGSDDGQQWQTVNGLIELEDGKLEKINYEGIQFANWPPNYDIPL